MPYHVLELGRAHWGACDDGARRECFNRARVELTKYGCQQRSSCGDEFSDAFWPTAGADGRVVFAAAGFALVVLGDYLSTRASIYQRSEFWTSSPTWFAIRVGILMTAVAALYALGEWASLWNLKFRPLERLGRSSLFVYWIHVELVYGYATWLLHRRLPLWGALAGCALFSLLMYQAVLLRDRIVEYWRRRPGRRSAPQTATA